MSFLDQSLSTIPGPASRSRKRGHPDKKPRATKTALTKDRNDQNRSDQNRSDQGPRGPKSARPSPDVAETDPARLARAELQVGDLVRGNQHPPALGHRQGE